MRQFRYFVQVKEPGCFFIHPRLRREVLLLSVETNPGGLNQGRLLYYDPVESVNRREFFQEKFFFIPDNRNQDDSFFFCREHLSPSFGGVALVYTNNFNGDISEFDIMDVEVPKFFAEPLNSYVTVWGPTLGRRGALQSLDDVKLFFRHIYERALSQLEETHVLSIKEFWDAWWLNFFDLLDEDDPQDEWVSNIRSVTFSSSGNWCFTSDNNEGFEIVIGENV